ncbi:hypothetical protein [Helicobacter pylori]|uniref:hypothetical protein n=1 Tax=Helicobacter pylori TaxID=210 RepID=UPI0003B2424D|nr:hypothetical protein [Helicobacter pylori]ERM20892.1 hypothetical protein H500_05865 [Helicobacter pylori CG-IMSS-2012]KHL88948.1 hypothetical protein HPY207_03265 [Helicobacter pylori]OPG25667.1 hypothetical protein BGL58_02425 [Helicobacter pylori]OPG37758.1 hypothetical protein BGL69_07850 [Helicobacter pylori]
MISFFALYCGVVFENRDKLALIIVVLWGMRACFWRYLDFSKPNRFKILTYSVKNFYNLSKP